MSISGISGSNSPEYSSTSATSPASLLSTIPSALASLNLTQTQQQQITQILKNAQTDGLSPSQVQSQIQSVLNPTQQSELQNESHHHHHHHHASSNSNSSTSSTSSSTSTEDAFGVTVPTSLNSTQSVADAASTFWLQSQLGQQQD